LEQKLIFLAQSLRPDREGEERVLRLGLKGEEGQQVVREGEAIFCHLVEHESGGIEDFRFGEGEVAMIPHMMDDRSLVLEVQKADEKPMEVVLKAAPTEVQLGDALAEARWLGEDRFFREYGGQEYRLLSEKQQLEVSSGKGSYVVYVGEGDFLHFCQGRWVALGRLEDANRDAPLAKVVRVGAELEIEAWDADGFTLFYTKLPKAGSGQLRFSADQVFSGAKLRTKNQVSCKMGKKRFILQPGDWILLGKEGSRKLRGPEEIEAYLDHQLPGQLIVIDRVDQNGRVSGKVFSESRTQLQPFVLQAVTSKGKRKR
jgi:hypothetical protein